ncbi:type VII toxin-antitoxin system HepT family RNase toxin [Meiothermus ruber]|uniref:type VII toxin-antitoxin system HepT family RNase toxin n=1 Tax=Meiothermus ruber TaxID=277 RepID=UPI0005654015|nr:DUF86 domain-containing protein [Meiothermus ruber]MCL6531492.1 DUF86 domain-containing protein [Meiothermus ruber]
MDEVLLGKIATIERCLKRIQEEYQGHEAELFENYTRQDAIVLNLLRACEASIDLAMYLVRLRRLGLPQSSRDAFRLLQEAGLIGPELARRMQQMVGFRNIAVHDYQALSLPILKAILEQRLGDFVEFTSVLLRQGNPES